jgi:hypothetical protein
MSTSWVAQVVGALRSSGAHKTAEFRQRSSKVSKPRQFYRLGRADAFLKEYTAMYRLLKNIVRTDNEQE